MGRAFVGKQLDCAVRQNPYSAILVKQTALKRIIPGIDDRETRSRQAGSTDDGMLRSLFERYHPPLRRYFGRLAKDGQEADDLVQEVFLRLVRRGGIGGVEKVSSFIFEIAANVSHDRYRRRRARRHDDHQAFDPDMHGGVAVAPDHILIDRERLGEVTRILNEMPERTREVFMLRRLEGMRYNDVADRIGVSVSTVEKEMQRAVQYLAAKLGD